jgi:hypothetical protein
MEHGVDAIVQLTNAGKFKAAVLGRATCAPCNADGKRIEFVETRDPRKEEVETLRGEVDEDSGRLHE